MPYQKSEALLARELETAPQKVEAGYSLLIDGYEAYLSKVLAEEQRESSDFELSDVDRSSMRDEIVDRFSEVR